MARTEYPDCEVRLRSFCERIVEDKSHFVDVNRTEREGEVIRR
jgi:hypothetical protein